MAYSRLPIPIQGLTDSLSFRQAAEGFTKRCENVYPFDAFDGRRRVGTRQGFLQIGNAGSAIQGMITTESFVDKGGASPVLKRQLVYVAGGKIFVTDLTGDPVQATAVSTTGRNAFNASYDSESSDITLQPRSAAAITGSQFAEALPDFTNGSAGSNQVFTADAVVELAVMKHVGRRDEINVGTQRAFAEINLTDTMNDNDTITITDNASTPVTKVYTAKASSPTASSQEFLIGASATATATNLQALIEGTNGHNGSIIVERDSEADGTIYLTQKNSGTGGNTTITKSSSHVTITTNFINGADDGAHNYCYMCDGTKYVKVDLSVSPAKISQWIGPYKTVNAVQSGTTYRAPLIRQFGARMCLAGIKAAPTNWFLSKINDPFDWTPGFGTGTETEAVAGSSGSKFGQIGDNIKCLVPVGTNSIVFGCTSSMTMLTGDPAFSDVQFRQISRSVGVISQRAFTTANEMSTLVASNEGVFMIDPNTFDIERGARVSKDRLDGLFSRLDFENTDIVMGYDDARSTCLMCITKNDDETSGEIFALDMAAGGWWKWIIGNPSMRGIKSICAFRPTDSDRTAPLLGTSSGALLSQPETIILHSDGGVDTSASFGTGGANHPPVTTAGTEQDFESELVIGPINTDPSRRVMLKDVRIILGEKGEDATDTVTTGPYMSLMHGSSAQAAIGFVSGIEVTTTTTTIDGGDEQSGSDTYETTTLGVAADGGDEAGGSDTYTAGLWGGLPFPADGVYTPQTTGTLLNNTIFAGPGSWTLKRNTDGKWELIESTIAYYQTTSAVSGFPTTIQLNASDAGAGNRPPPYIPDIELATLSSSGFGVGQQTDNVLLSRGRSTAKRSRIRASDIFVNIGAKERAWALEDISVDVEDGGPFRSV